MSAIYLTDVFKARFHQLAGFLGDSGNLRNVLVILDVGQLSIDQGVVDVLVD